MKRWRELWPDLCSWIIGEGERRSSGLHRCLASDSEWMYGGVLWVLLLLLRSGADPWFAAVNTDSRLLVFLSISRRNPQAHGYNIVALHPVIFKVSYFTSNQSVKVTLTS